MHFILLNYVILLISNISYIEILASFIYSIKKVFDKLIIRDNKLNV